TTAFDAKLIVCQSSVNCIFFEISWHRSKNARRKHVGHYPEQNNCRGEQSDCSLLQEIRRYAIEWPLSRDWRFINKNRFQHEKVIIQRDETATEAECDEPEQSLICPGMQCSAEQIELSKKSSQRRDACEGQYENCHASGEQRRTRRQSA